MANEDNAARAVETTDEAPNLLRLKPQHEVTDFDKLLNAGEKLLRLQQDRLSKAESDYQKQRTELIERYRASIERTKREAEDQVRLLDQAHAANAAMLERTITSLKGLRG